MPNVKIPHAISFEVVKLDCFRQWILLLYSGEYYSYTLVNNVPALRVMPCNLKVAILIRFYVYDFWIEYQFFTRNNSQQTSKQIIAIISEIFFHRIQW